MKIKTSELTGPALDWAVAKIEGALAPLGNVTLIGKQLFLMVGSDVGYDDVHVTYEPSTDWAQGGPIIEREKLQLEYMDSFDAWACSSGISVEDEQSWDQGYGPTPLIAAMRCYVASKLGDEVDVPEELI